MFNLLEKALVSQYGVIATAIAGFGSLLADSLHVDYSFAIALGLALIVLSVGIYKEQAQLKLYNNDTIPIPIVISVDDNTPISMLHQSLLLKIEKEDPRFKNLDTKLKKYFNISDQMLMFNYEGDIYDNTRLVSFLQIIRYVLNDIQKRLDHKAQFHVLYLRRPAVGIALGGMFRTDGIVIYQNNDYNNTLDKVAIINSRKYKEKVSRYKKFDVIRDFKNRHIRKLLVAIQISSHNVNAEDDKFNDIPNRILIRSKGNGTIPVDKENVDADIWVEYAQEVYNVINKIKSDFDEISLVHSMPEAVAVILGMALENYWDINVYQYDTGEYENVINLKKIKYYF